MYTDFALCAKMSMSLVEKRFGRWSIAKQAAFEMRG